MFIVPYVHWGRSLGGNYVELRNVLLACRYLRVMACLMRVLGNIEGVGGHVWEALGLEGRTGRVVLFFEGGGVARLMADVGVFTASIGVSRRVGNQRSSLV